MAPPLGATAYAGRRRVRWRWVVFGLLLVVPILEIAVIIGIGKVIGGWPTLVLLLLESALGAWLVKREGGRAWRALRDALRTGRMPSRELSDAALILVGGALLLTPGFVTDLAGFLVIIPWTRPYARRILERAIAARLLGGGRRGSGPGVVEGHVVSPPQ